MSFSATEARKNSPCAFIGPPNVIECPINSLFFFSNCLSCKVLFEYMIQTHNRILYSILTKLTQKLMQFSMLQKQHATKKIQLWGFVHMIHILILVSVSWIIHIYHAATSALSPCICLFKVVGLTNKGSQVLEGCQFLWTIIAQYAAFTSDAFSNEQGSNKL